MLSALLAHVARAMGRPKALKLQKQKHAFALSPTTLGTVQCKKFDVAGTLQAAPLKIFCMEPNRRSLGSATKALLSFRVL